MNSIIVFVLVFVVFFMILDTLKMMCIMGWSFIQIWKDERKFRPKEDDDNRCEDQDYLFRCGIETFDAEGDFADRIDDD